MRALDIGPPITNREKFEQLDILAWLLESSNREGECSRR